MSCINIRELAKLVNSKKLERDYEVTAQLFQKKYDIKVLEEDFQMLLQTANRINKREKGKKAKTDPTPQEEVYQIFVFGELKLFHWVLILHSHANSLELTQYKDQNYGFLQSIFKSKSRIFIQFQVKEIIASKSKTIEQWTEQQIKILQQILKKRNDETEWKAISFQLFRNSEKKYFRSYAACREKWISHLNPNVKKGNWTLQEEIQLFSLIATYGCRWALISKEMKGSRSEHNIKNRYNSVTRSIKKQYRLSETSQLSTKVLKYLKLKLQKQVEKSILQKKMNKSVISADSLSSRDRSRELNKGRLNDSIVSAKSNSNSEMSEKFAKESKASNKQHQSVSILKDCDFEIKQEKKTNDREQNEQSQEVSILKQQKSSSEDVTNVRMLTLCEIESEYNRLLSFSLDTRYKDLFDDEQDFSDSMYQKSGLMFEDELYGYSWYNHNE